VNREVAQASHAVVQASRAAVRVNHGVDPVNRAVARVNRAAVQASHAETDRLDLQIRFDFLFRLLMATDYFVVLRPVAEGQCCSGLKLDGSGRLNAGGR